MKNNKFVLLILIVSLMLTAPLVAQNKFNETISGSIQSLLPADKLTAKLVKAAKLDDDYEKLNSLYEQILSHPQKDIIVSNAIKELFENENYDSFLYLYDLAQKEDDIAVPAKVKTNILETLVFHYDEFSKDNFFELLDGTLEYLDASEIRDNFDSSYLLVKTLAAGSNYEDILEAMRRIIIQARTPNNLKVNFDPKTKSKTNSVDKKISLLGYWALKYNEVHDNSEANAMFATALVINGANINEEINGEYIWQIVNKSKPSKDIKEIFGL